MAREADALRKRGQWKEALDRLWSVAGPLGAGLDARKLPAPVFLFITEELLRMIELGVLVYCDAAQPEGAVPLLRDAAKRARNAAKRCAAGDRAEWEERARSFAERADRVEHFERDQRAAVRDLMALGPASQRIARLFARRMIQLPQNDREDLFQREVLRACNDAIGPELASGAIDLGQLLARDGERIIATALRVATVWPRHPLIRI